MTPKIFEPEPHIMDLGDQQETTYSVCKWEEEEERVGDVISGDVMDANGGVTLIM